MRKAREHGVVGWVRNTRDGRVELLASGEDDALAAFVDACRTGPTLCRVDNVEAHADSEKPAKGFTKRFTLEGARWLERGAVIDLAHDVSASDHRVQHAEALSVQ